jgi:hypothetical protein
VTKKDDVPDYAVSILVRVASQFQWFQAVFMLPGAANNVVRSIKEAVDQDRHNRRQHTGSPTIQFTDDLGATLVLDPGEIIGVRMFHVPTDRERFARDQTLQAMMQQKMKVIAESGGLA